MTCGSHCRSVFSWENPANPRQGLPMLRLIPPSAAANKVPERPGIRSYDRVETIPGIDQFGDLEQMKSDSIGPLLSWAKAVVPPHLLKTTPIFLFATGGVRSMPKLAQDKLMSNIVFILESSGFR